ncbi:regulatory protein [Dysgonomonadaceae bacterium PH5-43]|nr:regulatory protein [Dysgonomonadaceae bacterium PH5-43]
MTYDKALYRLATYCSKGEKCVYDVRKKMNLWELTEEEKINLITYLKKEKFIDEERYCRAFVNDKIRYNKWGLHKIKFELKKKNISESVINDCLSIVDKEDVRIQLKTLIDNKRKSVKGKNDYEIKQKLMRFAVGRGYSISDIEEVMRINSDFDADC